MFIIQKLYSSLYEYTEYDYISYIRLYKTIYSLQNYTFVN